MDVHKEDVKRLVEHLELPYFHTQLDESFQLAKSDATDENLQRLVSHHQVATDKCIEADAAKQAALWNTETRYYFNAFVDPIWTLLGECRQFIRKKGQTPTLPVPRPLSPSTVPRSRKPSFTVADYVFTKKSDIESEGGAGNSGAKTGGKAGAEINGMYCVWNGAHNGEMREVSRAGNRREADGDHERRRVF